MKNIPIIISLFLLIPFWVADGQEKSKSESPKTNSIKETMAADKFIGFSDKNKDGINDKFIDADGDGKNDIDKKEYPHKFKFIDKNKDKINDLWMDADGDGVNDYSAKFKGKEKKEIHNNILDVNEDSRNDITGKEFETKKYQYKGESFGFWNETKGELQGRFIDEDGDGIDDRMKNFAGLMKGHGRGQQDVFIDEDGDGICDKRTDFLNRMGRHGSKGRHGGKKQGGGSHH